MKRLWGKRFAKGPSPLAEAFTSGRDVRAVGPADERLIPYDLWGSRAHAVMLARQGIIARRDARLLLAGLREVEEAWLRGKFRLDPAKEDVHTNIESYLIGKYGMEAGGRLHTARSRNDQVAVDMRLYLRDCALDFLAGLQSLAAVLLREARRHRGVLLPGYTHHQPAQVTSLGHIWLSFGEAFLRDGERFRDWCGRFNFNPLGSMTGYGTSFSIDRNLTSRLLGFEGPCPSSLDPIQNRWEAEAELGFGICAMMNHLSSLAQTLILFSTQEFGLVRLDDGHSTGSSMMPQKRNPDTLEVMKAKAAVAQGLLASLLSMGRSLFLGYNRETQWTKYLVMDLVDESLPAPGLMGEILSSLKVNRGAMADRCRKGFIGAPDLVEEMVRRMNLPFRQAKGVVERAIRASEEAGADWIVPSAWEEALRLEGLKAERGGGLVARGEEGKALLSARKAPGGPGAEALARHALQLSRSLQESRRMLAGLKKRQSLAKARLERMERAL